MLLPPRFEPLRWLRGPHGQTVFGKSTAHVARTARTSGKAVLCLPGSLGPGWEEAAALFDLVFPLEPGSDAAKAVMAAATKAR